MMQSTEIKALILQWYESISSGDVLGPAERLFSRQEGLLAIGSDPTECGRFRINWKIVHAHYSIGVTNEEIGYEAA